ncbi:extensin-like protein [Parasponia andersonii]|uniref:Extensin-like protein n=1 Tax=Parasponia andersonii TaxID=3476 RepID=A0A2P5BF09_PARAD|nr:extensin-like protein [Parasponia andersonii]
MAVDESFKKPGAVPFKWEIKPGVPKQQQQKQQNQHRSISQQATGPPQKLRPPPSGSIFLPPPEPRTSSFRSRSRTRSERWRFDAQSVLFRSEAVSTGCFPSPLLKKKGTMSNKKESRRRGQASEPDYTSELETLARWSVSSRRSVVSPFRDSVSPPSSSRSSYQSSSPRPVSDAEWASFGLF